MRLNEVNYDTLPPIEGYGPGFFRIGGAASNGPTLILPSGVQAWDGLSAEALVAEAQSIDVVLFGTGATMDHAPEAFVQACEAAGIGVEVMASAPACRTYNVLLGEGCQIAAALKPVQAPPAGA